MTPPSPFGWAKGEFCSITIIDLRSNLGSRVVTLRGARKCVILRLRQTENGSRVREKKLVECNYSRAHPRTRLDAVRGEARKAIFNTRDNLIWRQGWRRRRCPALLPQTLPPRRFVGLKAASPGATGRVRFIGVGLGEIIREQIGGNIQEKE